MEGIQSGFDRRLWRRFAAIALPFWISDQRWRARLLLLALVALLLGQTGFNVLFNQETGEFTSALAARDADRFWSSIRRCFAMLAVAVPIWAFYYYVRDYLGLVWRRWLTTRFLERYFESHAYYALNASTAIDNPDQRIAEDINSFTRQSLYFLMIAGGALIELLAFVGVLWSISQELVYFLVAYALGGTLITTLGFGPRLVVLNYRQLQREANFRFGLVRVRENAEAIAFHLGERFELRQVFTRFGSIFANMLAILRWQRRLNLFQYAFSLLTIVLPSVIVADEVLSGQMEVGRAVQAAGAFAAILSALTVIIEHFEELTRFTAGVERLHAFDAALDDPAGPRGEPGPSVTLVESEHIEIDRLSLFTPRREHRLLEHLSLSVMPGEGLLIVGASGRGKSSLMRAMAGLWHTGDGSIARPGGDATMFLPQQPYMTVGTLREQVLYPRPDRSLPDDEVERVLASVNLAELSRRFGGLESIRDWGKLLSVGEQQRLAFARVLVEPPRYVMLDEATSALDAANEANLYRRLAEAGITPVSVGHRPALLAWHPWVLELLGGGRWRLVPSEDFVFSANED